MNKVLLLTLTILVIMTMTACVSKTVTAGEQSPAVILGFERSPEELKFRVISNGCTTKDNFIVNMREDDSGSLLVTLLQVKADNCKRMPKAQEITYTSADLGLTSAPVKVLNTITSLATR